MLYYQTHCTAEPKSTGWQCKHGTKPAPLLTKLGVALEKASVSRFTDFARLDVVRGWGV